MIWVPRKRDISLPRKQRGFLLNPFRFSVGGASITWIDSQGQYANNITVTVNAPAGLAAGDLLVFFHYVGNTARTVSTPPAGSTLQFTDTTAPPAVGGIRVYTKVATGSEPSTYSLTLNSSNRQTLSVHCYRGASAIDVIGAVSVSNVAPSISPSAAGVLLGAFSCEDTTSATINTPPGGMTQRAFPNGDQSSQAVYELNPSPSGASGTKTIVWASGVSASSFLMQIT